MYYKPLPRKKTYAKRSQALTPTQQQEVKKQVERTLALHKDYKICTCGTSAVGVDFSGTMYDLLTNMTRGDLARNNFEGAHLQVHNIHIRGQVAAADLSNVMRIIVFQWYDDTAPTATSILDNTGIIGTVDAPFATRNWSNRPLYKILRDDSIQLTANTSVGGGPGPVKHFDYFIKSKKITKTFYAATSGGVQKGGLYMLVVSDSGAASHPQIIFQSEMIFTDE